MPRREALARCYVEVSPHVFALLWVSFLALHVLCLVYFACVTRFYWTSHDSYLGSLFRFYKLGLDPVHYPVLAVIFGLIAAYHALQIACIVVWSAVKRRWSVSFLQEFAIQEVVARFLSVQRLHLQSRAVEGSHFEVVLIIREVIETSLQSNQAYSMSVRVPRPWLNRLYVALIIVNCLMTPLLHTVFSTKRLVRRTALLAFDAVLDLFSSVILPSLQASIYLCDYDATTHMFPASLLQNDLWFVNASNELELLLISSWVDLASTVLFSTAFMTCLEIAKSLVRTGTATETRPSPSAIAPSEPSEPAGYLLALPTVSRRRFERLAHYLFGVWGVVVLVMHLHAERAPSLPQCAMQVRPWLIAKPACAMVLLDCHRERFPGQRDDVAGEWVSLEHVYVVRLVMRHCSKLQMPPEIGLFRSLTTLKIYNSTIDEWSSDAALTHTHHPALVTVVLIRILLPNGELPLGLLSPDFPERMSSMQVCNSNLHTLPDDLDTKWPPKVFYLFEQSLFTAVPAVLERLAPQQLSFASNHLTEFPFAAFQWSNLFILNVGGNPISTLLVHPEMHSTSVCLLVLSDTNVTLLPSWADPVVTASSRLSRWGLVATRTPLCRNAEAIARGELSSFPGTEDAPSGSLSFAMAITAPQTTPLTALGVCAPFSTLFYPLAVEDLVNGIP